MMVMTFYLYARHLTSTLNFKALTGHPLLPKEHKRYSISLARIFQLVLRS